MQIKNLKQILIFVILFTGSFAFFTAKPQSDKNVPSKRTYTVGYMKDLFSEVEINDAQASIKVWINEIVKTYHYTDGYTLKAKIYNQFEDLTAEMKHDSLAILAMNTYDYLNYSDKIGLDPVLVPYAQGDIYAQYYILVRKKDHYKNIKDLKGTTLGVSSSQSQAASRLWLDVTMARDNIPDKEIFFKNITLANKESQLILNLFFGHLDVCIVSTGAYAVMKELNPQIGDAIISIQTSPKYLWGLVSFTKTFINERDRSLFYTNAIHVHELISGKQLFSLIKVAKLVPFKNDYLNSYKDLLQEYNFLLKTKKIKKNEFN